MLTVCDGHGDHGHFVSEYIKRVLPQILNNLSKGHQATHNLNTLGLGQPRLIQFGGKNRKAPVLPEPDQEEKLTPPLHHLFQMAEKERNQLLKTALKAL